jgi:copper resistance protein C
MRRELQNSAVSLLLSLIVLAGMVQPLWAHAVLMHSKPADNSVVQGPNVPIWLQFNVRVDGKRSHLTLIAPDGSRPPVGETRQTAPDTLETQLTGMKPGAYKLQWQVLASDGHISRGEVDFTVK